MSGLLAVVPVISAHTADVCIPSMLRLGSSSGFTLDDVLVVDNSREGFARDRYKLRTYRDPAGHNLGVARSWNVGAREVLERELDYLVIVSTVMQFGPILHTTWMRQMEEHWGANVIEADGHSWHLVAIHRSMFELVGLFDPAYYPAYEEQIDWCTRLRILGLEGAWPRVWVNALSQGSAMHNEMVSCPNSPLAAYYARKWGGKKGQEQYLLPWGDKPMGYFEEESIPVLAARYGLEVWW